jgi:hypothetical protein
VQVDVGGALPLVTEPERDRRHVNPVLSNANAAVWRSACTVACSPVGR